MDIMKIKESRPRGWIQGKFNQFVYRSITVLEAYIKHSKVTKNWK